MVLSFILIQNRQCVLSTLLLLSTQLTRHTRGKTRLAKWYAPYDVCTDLSLIKPSPPSPRLSIILTARGQDDEKVKLKGEVHRLVAPRDQKYQSNFVEFRNNKIVYRRYAGLFFCVCVDANDNELAYLEAIHFFVEVLDSFFGNVCELDLVFNFYKVRQEVLRGERGEKGGRGELTGHRCMRY